MTVEKHVLIASNPKSGSALRASLVNELNQALESAGFVSRIVTDLSELKKLATELHRSGTLEYVISAGGDGTVATLANLLPDDIEILIFPLGTENLLAKYYGLKATVQSAIETIANGRTETIDVGVANDQIFLVMLSIGFDAEVVREMSATRRGHINRFSYARPILRAMWRYRFPRLQIRLPGSGQGDTADTLLQPAWSFAFNVPRYAAGLDFCPQADPLDAKLDLCTFKAPGLMYGMGYLSRLALGSHQRMRGFSHRLCDRFEVECAIDRQGNRVSDIPYQIDGDFGGTLPLKVSVGAGRLKLRVPQA